MNERVENVKIQWIEFENLKTGLRIERIYFNRDVTLLVGLSGAGKTQILNAVEYSLNLAVDKDVILRPYRVGLGIIIDQEEYEWFYEIKKTTEQGLIMEEEGRYVFFYEKLLRDGDLPLRRNTQFFYFHRNAAFLHRCWHYYIYLLYHTKIKRIIFFVS